MSCSLSLSNFSLRVCATFNLLPPQLYLYQLFLFLYLSPFSATLIFFTLMHFLSFLSLSPPLASSLLASHSSSCFTYFPLIIFYFPSASCSFSFIQFSPLSHEFSLLFYFHVLPLIISLFFCLFLLPFTASFSLFPYLPLLSWLPSAWGVIGLLIMVRFPKALTVMSPILPPPCHNWWPWQRHSSC